MALNSVTQILILDMIQGVPSIFVISIHYLIMVVQHLQVLKNIIINFPMNILTIISLFIILVAIMMEIFMLQ